MVSLPGIPLLFALAAPQASAPAAPNAPAEGVLRGDAPLAAIKALLATGRAQEALDALEARRQAGGLSPAALQAVWANKGRAFGLLGQGQRAQLAFAVALRLDPEWRLGPREDDPEVKGPFLAALAALPPRSEALSVGALLEEGDLGRSLHYRLVADDLGLAKGARVSVEGHGSIVLSLDAEARATPLPSGAGSPSLALLDEHGNALLEEPLAARPAAAPPIEGLRWVALAGGTTMALGALGVMAAGIGLAATDDRPGASAGSREGFLGGALAATSLVAIGGAVIAADLLLDPP